jgi:hypothetical protein
VEQEPMDGPFVLLQSSDLFHVLQPQQDLAQQSKELKSYKPVTWVFAQFKIG